MTSYLAQLEAMRLQPREKVSEFFFKGLPDQNTAVAVGMKDPQTL